MVEHIVYEKDGVVLKVYCKAQRVQKIILKVHREMHVDQRDDYYVVDDVDFIFTISNQVVVVLHSLIVIINTIKVI